MNYFQKTAKLTGLVLLVLLLGGIGATILQRLVFPHLSGVGLFKNFSFLNPQAPLVITKHEEVRIDDGVNTSDVANKVKNSLVIIYVYQGNFGSPRFSLLNVVSGVIGTSDGVIISPQLFVPPGAKITVGLPDQSAAEAKILAADSLTGLTFLKIQRQDLSVIKQGFSQDVAVGEKLLAIWAQEAGNSVAIQPVVATSPSVAGPSVSRVYDFAHLNAVLHLASGLSGSQAGAVIVNRDAVLVGMVTGSGKDFFALRAEDLKLVLNNLLDDQKIIWPNLKLSYLIFGPIQAKLFNLPFEFGIMVKVAAGPLRENDFIYAVNGQRLTSGDDFQSLLLAHRSGDRVKLELMRSGQSLELEITL